ncbi:hypothetical protein L9F63_006405, partial [Diploptera punctata]
ENDIPSHCREILEKWKKVSNSNDEVKENNVGSGEDMDVKLVKLLESQPRPTAVQRTCTDITEEERRIREAIIAQYSQMSDQEDDGDPDRPSEGKENGDVRKTKTAATRKKGETQDPEGWIMCST